jgi:hypothetical protein
LFFEAMEGGIERALPDLENVAGNLLDAVGNGPSVGGLERENLQDE